MNIQKLLTIFSILMTTQIFALDNEGDAALLDNKFKISIDGEINYSFFNRTSDSQNVTNLKGSYLRVQTEFNKFVKAVVLLNLEHALKEDKLSINNTFDLDDWVEQAYVKVTRDIGGKKRALIIGKQPIPFGTSLIQRPLYNESALYNLQNIEAVYGITVDLGEDFLNFFDEI